MIIFFFRVMDYRLSILMVAFHAYPIEITRGIFAALQCSVQPEKGGKLIEYEFYIFRLTKTKNELKNR